MAAFMVATFATAEPKNRAFGPEHCVLPASSGNGQPGEQGAPSSGGAGLGQQDPSSGDGQQATAPPKPPGGKPGYYELIPEMIDVALKYLQIKGWGGTETEAKRQL